MLAAASTAAYDALSLSLLIPTLNCNIDQFA